MLVFWLRNVMLIPSLLLVFMNSVGDCWMLRRRISTPDLACWFCAVEVGSSSNNEGTLRSPQGRSPSSSQFSFPKGSESPNCRERISPQTQYSGSMSPNEGEKKYSSFKSEQGFMTSAIQNDSPPRSSSINPSRNKMYSQCYSCCEYGHHRYECPRRNISPSRSPGRHYSPSCAIYPRPGERF